jgi:uncharacterized DUF497 family protein
LGITRGDLGNTAGLRLSFFEKPPLAIEFDPAKAKANLRKHGVSFAHAEQVLRDPRGITIEDPDASGEQRFLTIGMDALGR